MGIFTTEDNFPDGGCPVLDPPPTCDPATETCLSAFTLFQDDGCGTPWVCPGAGDPPVTVLPDEDLTGTCR
jgi:hypothetical protein